MKIYDITLPLSAGTGSYPGDPETEISPVSAADSGDPFSLHRVTFSSHAGTHLDAPSHVVAGGMTVDRIPPERLLGIAVVIDVTGRRRITPDDLNDVSLKNRMLLLKTGGGEDYDPDHPFLTEEGARCLVRRGVTLVGIDTFSVEPPDGDGTVHRILLGSGILILERADLSLVPPGSYQFVCLPLPLAGCDGSPVRALLIDRSAAPFDSHTTRWPLS